MGWAISIDSSIFIIIIIIIIVILRNKERFEAGLGWCESRTRIARVYAGNRKKFRTKRKTEKTGKE